MGRTEPYEDASSVDDNIPPAALRVVRRLAGQGRVEPVCEILVVRVRLQPVCELVPRSPLGPCRWEGFVENCPSGALDTLVYDRMLGLTLSVILHRV